MSDNPWTSKSPSGSNGALNEQRLAAPQGYADPNAAPDAPTPPAEVAQRSDVEGVRPYDLGQWRPGPAAIRAATLAVTATLREESQTSGILTPGMVSDTTFAPATFAFPPFFAALRLIAVWLVVVGATVTVRPPTVSSVDAAPSS